MAKQPEKISVSDLSTKPPGGERIPTSAFEGRAPLHERLQLSAMTVAIILISVIVVVAIGVLLFYIFGEDIGLDEIKKEFPGLTEQQVIQTYQELKAIRLEGMTSIFRLIISSSLIPLATLLLGYAFGRNLK